MPKYITIESFERTDNHILDALQKRIKAAFRRVASPEKLSNKELKKHLWPIVSLYIRMRDCIETTETLTHGKCCTCGKFFPIVKLGKSGNYLQAGHYQRSWKASVKYIENNIHAQCYACNCKHHGLEEIHARFIDDKYGKGTAKTLENSANMKTKKYANFELIELIKYFKQKIEVLNEKIK